MGQSNMPIDPRAVQWDASPDPSLVQWDDEPAKTKSKGYFGDRLAELKALGNGLRFSVADTVGGVG